MNWKRTLGRTRNRQEDNIKSINQRLVGKNIRLGRYSILAHGYRAVQNRTHLRSRDCFDWPETWCELLNLLRAQRMCLAI
jgi:hypothetical protein